MSQNKSNQQASYNQEKTYHLHSHTDHTTHQDISSSQIKQVIEKQGFHPGHEKDIPEKKDMIDETKFQNIASNLDKHLGGPINNPDNPNDVWENTKDFIKDAKDAIVEGAGNVIEKVKEKFN
jgi:hypothetical protein